MIKTVLFDLDHTLLDRAACIKNQLDSRPRSYFPFCEEYTNEQIIEKIIELENPYIFVGLKMVIEELKKSGYIKKEYLDMPFDEYFDKFMREPLKEKVVPFPFAKEVLLKLKEMGLRVALLTNGEEEIQGEKIKSSGLEDCFDAIFISDTYKVRKPDYRLFGIVCEEMGAEITETAYVGDNPLNDMLGANMAGLIPIWVRTYDNWVFNDIKKPELTVKTVAELPELIKKYNKN